MCQTDLHGRDGYYPVGSYPAVFGHEGAGVVHAVGSAVREFAPGDHVIMSYPWCGECAHCRRQRLNYCANARNLKNKGTRADGSTLLAQNGAPVYGAFFQQSSFGTYALTQARYAVKVRRDAPLDLIGPLACSGQTGAGAVLNVLKPNAGESLAVFGAGAVGLSALMAAKIAGCAPLVAVDLHAHRLELARELGATHTINANACADVAAVIRAASAGGVHCAVDTSAVPKALREAVEVADARRNLRAAWQRPRRHRSCVRDAVPAAGPSVRGVVQGDSVPREFIPRLIDLMMVGKFPLEKMVKFYDLADINRAAAESCAGSPSNPYCGCRIELLGPIARRSEDIILARYRQRQTILVLARIAERT